MATRTTLKSVSAAAAAGASLAEALASGRPHAAELAALPPVAAAARAAVSKDPSAPGLLEPLETLLAVLARTSALLPPPPLPEPLPQALAGLGRVLRLTADLAAGKAGPADAGQIGALTASFARELRLARRAAESDPDRFVENLKFSNIYSGLENCFFRAEEEAERLARP
ncbi:MAG: hypothetical protein FD189_1664 [Elusimicrobia bacterium]|nr:MAG: hypothetical protein FD154_740 [Elusimicrobiota bacterium]KAF0154859.1 MAG: hypothetical protein FD189_1664 [Elusimicrobiota bacterium]